MRTTPLLLLLAISARAHQVDSMSAAIPTAALAAPLSMSAPSALLSPAASGDRQVALIGKLGSSLGYKDSRERGEVLLWIRDIVKENPRSDVHMAAVHMITQDPLLAHGDLTYMEQATEVLSHVAVKAENSDDFQHTVNSMIELAKKTGRAGRHAVLRGLYQAANDSPSAQRREYAADRISEFAAIPHFHDEAEEIGRYAARLRR